MNNKLEPELLKFLREAVGGRAVEYHRTLSGEAQERLLAMVKEQSQLPLYYYFLSDELPAEQNAALALIYRKRSIKMLKMQVAFKELCQLFESNQIRFAPFKGMDLAFRCYPASALRYLSDWDVLIHPDDCHRALELLAQAHWHTELPVDMDTMHHHYVQHFKNGICLEPHRTFAQFGNVDPVELWQYIHPVKAGSCQHILSAELNLLQLTCHAATWLYSHQPTVKLLLDAAWMLKKTPVNWAALRELSERWDLPYPGNLLSAYPEFFEAELLQEMQGDLRSARAYRELVESIFEYDSVAPGEFDINDERGGWGRSVKRGFYRMSFRALREKYHLPARGAYFRLIVLTGWDLLVKGGRFLKYVLHPDPAMKHRRKLIKTAEALKNER